MVCVMFEHIRYTRSVKPEWVDVLDALVKRLRAEEDAHMINDAKERFKGSAE